MRGGTAFIDPEQVYLFPIEHAGLPAEQLEKTPRRAAGYGGTELAPCFYGFSRVGDKKLARFSGKPAGIGGNDHFELFVCRLHSQTSSSETRRKRADRAIATGELRSSRTHQKGPSFSARHPWVEQFIQFITESAYW